MRRRRDWSVAALAAVAAAVAALSLWIAMAVVGSAAAEQPPAERVAVRAWNGTAAGRLIFDWRRPVDYTASIEDNALTIFFARPADFRLDAALAELSDYVLAAEVTDQGRRVALRLAGVVDVRHFADGSRVILDLAAPPTDALARLEPAAGDATDPSGAGAAVRVRAGEHPGFSRLVFDWTTKVGYSVTQDGDTAVVRFDQPRALDLTRVHRSRPVRVRSIQAAVEGAAATTRVIMTPGARLHHFRDGTKVVLDVLAPGAVPARPSAPQEAAPAESDASAPRKTAPAMSESPPAQAAAESPPTPVVSSPPPQPVERSAPEAIATPTMLVPPPAAIAETASPEPATEPARVIVPPAAPDEPGQPQASAAVPSATLDSVPVRVAADGEGVALRVEWPAPVSAAAFRRAGSLWLVFDRPARFDLREVTAASHPFVGQAAQRASGAAAVLLLTSSPKASPRLTREGTHWIVDLRPRAEGPDSIIPQRIERHGVGGVRLMLQARNASDGVRIEDPEVGDQVVVVPLPEVGAGLLYGQNWPEFELLPTIQGIAIVPRIDDLIVQREGDGVAIGSDTGLLVSDEATRLAAARRPTAAAPREVKGGRLFDLPAWRRNGPANFVLDRQTLQRAVIEVPADQQEIARLDLARFLFAHGLGAEAAGVLELIRNDLPIRTRDPELLLLSGASSVLMRDAQAAERFLSSDVLDGEPEAELWRAALAASTGDWKAAAQSFARTAALVDDYPKSVRFRLRLLAAEAAIEAGNPVGALNPLDALWNDSPDAEQSAQITFMDGRQAAAEGNILKARRSWESLLDNAHQPTRAQALLALTESQLKDGEITQAEAIDRFEQLRFMWRGGPFEFTVLHRLGQLYLAEGAAREGLTILRQAASNFPDDPRSGAATQEMADGFRQLYLDGRADHLSPLESVALFEEFRELTPAGKDGDAMIAALADRLVAVDLLDRAAALLEDQVKFRLSGIEKTRAGTRLAAIRLLDRKPDAALAALRTSAGPDLPADLARQRRQLEARALFELRRGAEALAILEGDDSEDAALLRADMLWRLEEWSEAAEAFARLLDMRETAADPNGVEEGLSVTQLVLNQAIALSLSGDAAGLGMLADRYGTMMADSPLAEPFRLLTTEFGEPDAMRSIAERLAGIGQIESFLAAYRSRLQTASLSGQS